jgi:hypothetical protein
MVTNPLLRRQQTASACRQQHLAQCSHVCCHTRQRLAVKNPRHDDALITLRGVGDVETGAEGQRQAQQSKPVKQESDLLNAALAATWRGLLGFGKMKDFDLDLNSEPFADIPDDEVASDLEMLMREMGQAPPPRAAPAAAPRAQTVRQRTSACRKYVSGVRGIVVLR